MITDRKHRQSNNRRKNDGLRTKLVKILYEYPEGLSGDQLRFKLKDAGWRHTGSIHQITQVLRMTPGVSKSRSGNNTIWLLTNENAWREYINA
tara:strand:- start:313 stop:591 length:279 start_codon:yes stop_codon:yes gene_type:complete